jgi:hypothetical protein
VQENVLPATFEANTQQSAYLFYSVLLIVLGIVAVILLERFGKKTVQK